MVRYDSLAKTLELVRTTQVDGQKLMSPATIIPLHNVKEDVRQLLISMAKLAIAYANGNELTLKRSTKVDDVEKELPSLKDEFIARLNRLQVPKPKEVDPSTDSAN